MRNKILYHIYDFLRWHSTFIIFITQIEDGKKYINKHRDELINDVCLLTYYKKRDFEKAKNYTTSFHVTLSYLYDLKFSFAFNLKVISRFLDEWFIQYNLYDYKYINEICKKSLKDNNLIFDDEELNYITNEVIKFFKYIVPYVYLDRHCSEIDEYIKK